MLKSFQIGGQTINVKQIKVIYDKKNKNHLSGLFSPGNGTIKIATNNPDLNSEIDDSESDFLRKSNRNEAICHETVHGWLSTMCEYDLDSNEPFVQKLGMALHQFLKTAKWEQNVKIIDGKLNIS